MSRKAAAFTQADVERVVRAAKRQGAARVTVKIGGTEIAVDLEKPELSPLSPPAHVATRKGRPLC